MRCRRVVMVAAVLTLALAAPAGGQSFRVGLALEQSGQADAALLEYCRALAAPAPEMSAYQGLVRIAEALGRFDTLASVSRRLAGVNPERPEYAVGLVRGLLGLRRNADALAETRRAGTRWPDRLPALAEALADYGEHGAAVRLYLQARVAGGDSAAFADRLIASYEALGDITGAVGEIVGEIGRQRKLPPDHRQKLAAYASRGNSGRLLGELERIPDAGVRARAQAAVYLATKRAPEAVRVMKALGDAAAYQQFGRECEAEGELDAALLVHQESGRRVDAARVLRRLGRTPEALRELEQSGGLDAQVELGNLLLEQREFERAAAAFAEAARLRPQDEAAALGLGSARLAQGRLADARAAARSLPAPSDRLLLLVAGSFFYAGEFDSCRAAVAELARRFPQSVLVNDGLELAVVAGAGERAVELARAMLDLETGDDQSGIERARALTSADTVIASHAHLLLARFERRRGRPKDALARLDTLAGRYPAGPLAPRAAYEKAIVYREDLRDPAKYKEALERLLLSAPASPWAPVARSLLSDANRPVGPVDVR